MKPGEREIASPVGTTTTGGDRKQASQQWTAVVNSYIAETYIRHIMSVDFNLANNNQAKCLL